MHLRGGTYRTGAEARGRRVPDQTRRQMEKRIEALEATVDQIEKDLKELLDLARRQAAA